MTARTQRMQRKKIKQPIAIISARNGNREGKRMESRSR
jgi:hypothetical protein